MSSMFARIRVDSTSTASSIHDFNARVARSRCPKGGESIVTFTDLVEYLRARFEGEKGQTMAEYGVALALITVASVAVFPALGNAVLSVVDQVTGLLP